jgi:Mg2+-importing ATPase
LTELAVALVVRTRRPFHDSRPGASLLATTIVIAVLAVAIPYLPFRELLGFTALPVPVLLLLLAITVLYVAAIERLKVRFRQYT